MTEPGILGLGLLQYGGGTRPGCSVRCARAGGVSSRLVRGHAGSSGGIVRRGYRTMKEVRQAWRLTRGLILKDAGEDVKKTVRCSELRIG